VDECKPLDAGQYYRQPYRSVGTARQFIEYVVLDIEPVQGREGGAPRILPDYSLIVHQCTRAGP